MCSYISLSYCTACSVGSAAAVSTKLRRRHKLPQTVVMIFGSLTRDTSKNTRDGKNLSQVFKIERLAKHELPLVHAVAQVHKSLVVAVYPDKANPRKLEIDDGVDGQSQRCGKDQRVQPGAFLRVAHPESCDQ